MKSSAKATVSLLLFLPMSTLAGPLYGTIRGGSNPKQIEVGCPDFGPQAYHVTRRTDSSGSFRINVARQGRCLLRVDNSFPITVYSSDNPIRYDFELVGQQLRRR